ncbi:MAG: ATP-binding protein [Actinomycetota bacterium]
MSQPSCERCGASLPEGARFCPSCGYAVDAAQDVERKVVTLLFVDLAGSTELSTRLDPERFREVMAAFYRAVADEIQSLRGRAESFSGDAVLGVFGVPHAHDDDALRAVRAALSVRDRLGRLGEELALPMPIRARAGISTGSVAVAAGPGEQVQPAGSAVNLAARLQQAAEPDNVLVSDTTWQLTRGDVEFGPKREVAAKGFEEAVPAWPVVAVASRSSRRTIPFVNRRRELALLLGTLERVGDTARGHLVTLFGEPGIGKTRLAHEFLAGLSEETEVLVGRASPFEEEETFAPLAQMLLAQLGAEGDEPSGEIMMKLERAVEACCRPSEVPQVVARLAVALGIGEELRDPARYRVAEVRSGLLAFVEGLTRKGPAVMVFEDLHLAQPALLDLVEQFVRDAKGIPVLVLCVSRYGLLETRPDWGGGLGDSLNLYLEPLSPPDAVQLVHEAGEGLDDETAERIARHAGGNPFFIVETTGMLVHRGSHLPTTTGPLPSPLLPPTVQAVVAARIDHLPGEARDLLRKASVFARGAFDRTELGIIAEPHEEVLGLLEGEELLVHDEERPRAWRFRDGLVRDVAYESLAKRERQRLHLRVANKLSEPPTAGRRPRAIAYHLEQAARAALDLDPKDRTLADRAVEALAHAGDLDRSGIESRGAVDLYERALALAGPERGWGAREALILAGLGESRYWLGEFEAAVGPLTRALDVGGDDVRVRAQASRFLADIELSVRGDRERAAELFDRALAAAREMGDPWTLARVLLTAGWAPWWRGDLEQARAMFEEALEVARSNPEHDAWAEARSLVTLATVNSSTGDEEDSLALARQALAIGEETGDPFTVAVAQENVGNSLRRMWRLVEADPVLEQAVRSFRELGARWELASALTSRGVLLRLRGRLEEAEQALREAFRITRDLKERSLISWTAGELARVFAATRDLREGRRVLEDAAAQTGGRREETSSDLVVPEVVVLLAAGDEEGALANAVRLLEVERDRAWPNDLASLVWWIGRVFGADVVGGEEEIERARKTLEAAHWVQALTEPELVRRGGSSPT